jgi:putative transposase
MGVGPLYKLFGKTRQAYYDQIRHLCDKDSQDELALEIIRLVRSELPGLGRHKLYKCLYAPFRAMVLLWVGTNYIRFCVDISY